jgi:hypothetical protein
MKLNANGMHVQAESDDFLVAMVDTEATPENYLVLRRCGKAAAKELNVAPGSVYLEFNDQLFGGFDLLQSVTPDGPTGWRLLFKDEAVELGLPKELDIRYVGVKPLPRLAPPAFAKLCREVGQPKAK